MLFAALDQIAAHTKSTLASPRLFRASSEPRCNAKNAQMLSTWDFMLTASAEISEILFRVMSDFRFG
jgi:hypothetical protein